MWLNTSVVWQFHKFWMAQTCCLTKIKRSIFNEWYSKIENSSNSSFYRVFKRTFGFESYLAELGKSLVYFFVKFRTRNHRFPIETGIWTERQPIKDYVIIVKIKLVTNFITYSNALNLMKKENVF